ncbi:MAG: GDP-mannose 4,6-dehydratase, partial [Succinivibrionaceae bacterium]|nr:GDP-mannose 4,6-dehydratase [Succinivibrionaceae bacterium]
NKEYCIQYPDCPCSKGQSAKTLITHVTDRLGHDRRYAIDAHKIMTELGYKPKDSFETGIAKTIRWYLDHHEWWFKLVK